MRHIKHFHKYNGDIIISESFDKYDFKIYSGLSTMVQHSFEDMLKHSIEFPIGDLEIIEKVISEYHLRSINNNNNKAICTSLVKDDHEPFYLFFHYLGDYIYSVTVIDEYHDDPIKMIICDTIENLIIRTKRLLK